MSPSTAAKRPTIATPILLFFLLAAGIVLAGFAFHRRDRARATVQAHGELAAIASLKVREIAAWRHEREADAQVVTSNTVAALELGRRVADDTTPERVQGLGTWLAALQQHNGYQCVALLDPAGGVRWSRCEGPALVPDEATRARLGEVLRTRRPWFGDLERDAATGRIHLDLLAPLVTPEGLPAGAVLLRVDPARYLFPLVETWPTAERSAETLLVRRDGESVLFLNTLRHRHGTALALRSRVSDPLLAAAIAMRGRRGAFAARDYRGIPVLAVALEVPGSPWLLVSKIDTAEVLAPLAARGRLMAGIIGLLVVVAGLAVVLTWRRREMAFLRQQVAAAGALRASEESLATTLHSIGDAVIATDAQGCDRMNPAAEQLTGWSASEARHRPLAEIFRIVHAVSREPAGNPAERVLREGRVIGLANHTSLISRDGSERPIADSGAPIRDAQGKVTGVVLVFHDASRERDHQQTLAYQASVLANLNEAVIAIDADFTVRSWNLAAEQIVGWKAGEVIGRALAEVLPVEQEEKRTALRQTLIATGSVQIDLRYLRRDGTPLDAEVAGEALRDEHGTVTGYVAVLRDISERRRVQARLLLADRMVSIGTLAAGVAHEINNPLTYLLGNLEYASQTLREAGAPAAGPPPFSTYGEVQDALQEAQEGAERVRAIVRDLKTLSRADDDREGPVDVVQVVKSSISMARNEIRHVARLTTDLAPVARVHANESRLGQVFVNLLINAAQAIDHGSIEANGIHVATRQDPSGSVTIEIRDTGTGIAPAMLTRIFDPFYTTKPVGVGTGLGLSICQGIITALGGEIRVESTVGKGSTFRVVLPAAASVQPAAEAPGPPRPPDRARILVIDDDALVGRSVRRLLQRDHEVHVVVGGKEALGLLADGKPFDLILCDLMMPGMTGMDFYDLLQSRHPDLAGRIAFITGGACTPRARDFLDRFPHRYLEKPVHLAKLQQLIDQMIRPG